MKNTTKVLALLSITLMTGSLLSPSVTLAKQLPNKATSSTLFENKYKKVVTYDKNKIAKLTGNKLNSSSIDKIVKKLQTESTWTSQGYTTSQARVIAKSAKNESNDIKHILTKMTKKDSLQLKLILINNPHHSSAHFGGASMK